MTKLTHFLAIPMAVFFFSTACSKDTNATTNNPTVTTTTTNNLTKPALSVKLEGLRNTDGTIQLLVFDKADGFPDVPANAVYSISVPATTTTINIPSLAYGTYAVTILHDENNNQKMDKNILGIPKEGYGFSRNATGFAGPPAFDKASITYSEQDYSTIITLKYW